MNTSSHAANGVHSGRLAEPMTHMAAALAKGAAKVGLKVGLKSVRKKATSMYRRSLSQAGALTEGTVGYVRENPIKTMLVAVGLGALIGFLLTRRN